MLKKIIFITLYLLPWCLSAQYDAPLRIELESAKDKDDYFMAPVGEKGVFVGYEGNLIAEDTTTWVLIHYDTNLQKDYHFIIPMPAFTEYINFAKSDNYLYIILQKRFPKKSPVLSFLLTIDLQKNIYNIHLINNLINNQISVLNARDGELVIQAANNKRDSLYFYDCNHQIISSLYSKFDFRTEFCELDTFNCRWLIGLSPLTNQQTEPLKLYERNYLTQQETIQNFPTLFPNNTTYVYNSARAVVINKDSALIIGTYNTLQDKYSSNLHSGVYTIQLLNNQMDSAKFYNYASLKTKSTNIEVNNQLKKDNLNFQLLIGDISHNDKQYTFFTEIFYPEYNYAYGSTGYDVYYGNTGFQNTPTFVGYRFINAYITTFDAAGNLLWDNFFPFNNLITQQLSNRLSIDYIDDFALVYYPFNNYFTHTLFNKYEVIKTMETSRIETNYTNDVVDYSRKVQLKRWYRNYYLASGYQYIRHKGKGVKSKRYVFYMNKLLYR